MLGSISAHTAAARLSSAPCSCSRDAQLSQPQLAAIVGPGRVGRAIAAMCQKPPLLLGRTDQIPPNSEGPILVCTTNDALEHVIQATPKAKRPDLVFTQNGMLLPWLSRHQLQANTQVLLYMSASNTGIVVDGGLTCVAGRWAPAVQAVLQQGGVACEVVDWHTYHARMIIKLLWASIFWMMSAALGGAQVGYIAKHHASDVEALVQELLPIAVHYLAETQQCNHQSGAHNSQPRLGVSVSAHGAADTARPGAYAAADDWHVPPELQTQAVCQALLAYSLAIAEAVPSSEMAQREIEWRNGFFLRQGALMRDGYGVNGGQGRRTCVDQLHLAWLQRAGCSAQLIQQCL